MQIDDSRLRLLYDLGCAFSAHLELGELVPLVVTKCREVFDAEGAAVLLLDRDRDELYFPWADAADPDVAARLESLRFPATQGIAGAVLQSGTALRSDDVSGDPRFYAGIDRSTGLATRAMLTAPLAGREGALGVVQVVNPRRAARFDDDDLAFLGALAGSVSVAVENARLWARMKASAEQLRGEVLALRRDRAHVTRFGDMIGTGAAMTEVFRLDDLYYRVGAFPIPLPALRHRREDIPLLAERFLSAALARHGKPPTTFVPTTLALLERFDWPGNVRELQNEIERAVALAGPGEQIGPDHLSAKLRTGDGTAAEPAAGPGCTTSDLREARTAFEVDFIAKVLREHGDNVSHAAKALGISRVALQKKLKEYGLR